MGDKKEWLYPTAFQCWGAEEAEAIERVLMCGRFTMGKEVAALENEFADFHGMKYGIAVNSGSSANLVVVSALRHTSGIVHGDEILVPALAWSTTYAPLVQHEMELTLVDCDDTWNAAATKPVAGADLIVACSILGNPADLPAWKQYTDESGVVLIEDNCESLGASINGKLCGTFGLMNTFSFFWSHQIGAIEGGMILTDDDEYARLCRMLRDHGLTRSLPDTKADFDHEYDFRVFGYNVRPLEMHAAIARAQLKKLPAFIEARRANERTFKTMTEVLPIKFPTTYDGAQTSPFGIAFEVKDTETRRMVVAALRSRGIDCRQPTGGSFRLHDYGAPWGDQQTPNADRIHRCGLFIGNAPFDISELIFAAVQVLREVLR